MRLLDRRSVVTALILLATAGLARGGDLDYAPSPPDNPLKGFVPYAGQGRDFPHSLEFDYLPLRSLMKGPDEFTWEPMERLLDGIAGRGSQAVVRIYLEYPRKSTGVPQFLVDGGLTLRDWTIPTEKPPARIQTPDYEDPKLRAALVAFIRAFGAKYDNDPRLAYVTAGLLGMWGEWHDYPRDDWFASKAVQREVLDAYAGSFRTTPVLLRYPAGEGDEAHEPTANRPFGYHDDSFAWGTLDTGREEDSWFYLAALNKAGPAAQSRWKTQPIGGEIRPELWKCIWTEAGCNEGQDYARCVAETHASWLMESSTNRRLKPADRERAIAGARRLGYEFHVASAECKLSDDGRSLSVSMKIKNTGVAPFYRDWPMEVRVIDAKGEVACEWITPSTLRDILPGEPASTRNLAKKDLNLAPGRYKVLLRVANPLPTGKPVRFANKAQDEDAAGWLTLGQVTR